MYVFVLQIIVFTCFSIAPLEGGINLLGMLCDMCYWPSHREALGHTCHAGGRVLYEFLPLVGGITRLS